MTLPTPLQANQLDYSQADHCDGWGILQKPLRHGSVALCDRYLIEHYLFRVDTRFKATWNGTTSPTRYYTRPQLSYWSIVCRLLYSISGLSSQVQTYATHDNFDFGRPVHEAARSEPLAGLYPHPHPPTRSRPRFNNREHCSPLAALPIILNPRS